MLSKDKTLLVVHILQRKYGNTRMLIEVHSWRMDNHNKVFRNRSIQVLSRSEDLTR